MISVRGACLKLLADLQRRGFNEAEAIDLAIDKVSHDVVYFKRIGIGRLERRARNKLLWLKDEKQRVAEEVK